MGQGLPFPLEARQSVGALLAPGRGAQPSFSNSCQEGRTFSLSGILREKSHKPKAHLCLDNNLLEPGDRSKENCEGISISFEGVYCNKAANGFQLSHGIYSFHPEGNAF